MGWTRRCPGTSLRWKTLPGEEKKITNRSDSLWYTDVNTYIYFYFIFFFFFLRILNLYMEILLHVGQQMPFGDVPSRGPISLPNTTTKAGCRSSSVNGWWLPVAFPKGWRTSPDQLGVGDIMILWNRCSRYRGAIRQLRFLCITCLTDEWWRIS
jgi:hypothetical protein